MQLSVTILFGVLIVAVAAMGLCGGVVWWRSRRRSAPAAARGGERGELASAEPSDVASLLERLVSDVSDLFEVSEKLQSRLRAAEEKLQQQAAQVDAHVAEARLDPLTRLPNRRYFDAELVGRVAAWQRRQAPFGLMIVNVDHFRAFNERHGCLAGDQALRRMAEVIRAAIRPTDMAARIGGQEFAVLLPDSDLLSAQQAAEQVRTAIEGATGVSRVQRQATGKMPVPPGVEDDKGSLTVSIGLSTVQTGDDPASLVHRADEALYTAKCAGRNCGYFHNGLSCQRIVPAGATDAEWKGICHDLRQRMVEVIE